MKVKDVMTHEVRCTRPDASLYEAARLMKDGDIGSLPVCGEDRRLVGMVTDRDLVLRGIAEGQDPVMMLVRKVMTPTVVTCQEDEEMEQGARLMEQHRVRRLVVLDRAKRIAGIVTLGDLAAHGSPLASRVLESLSTAVPSRH